MLGPLLRQLDFYQESLVINWNIYSHQFIHFTLSFFYLGLDPSEYAFPLELIDNCLDITDASFVDVIHTSEISYKNAVGHVDFYPNGGFLQSGCPPRIPDPGNFYFRFLFLFVKW